MELSTIIAVLLLAALSGFTTVIGVVLAIRVGRSPAWIAGGIGFSVGIMLLISVFELIPESLNSENLLTVAVFVMLGALLIGALHYVIPHTHLFEEKGLFGSNSVRVAYLAVLGLILHDFPEGFAMANAYITAPTVGVAVAVAIAFHNIPEEFAIAVPAVTTKSNIFLYRAAIISALAEPVGAVIGLFAGSAEPKLVPIFLSFAAGAMIFVSVHELIPMAKKYGRPKNIVMGMLASVMVYALLAVLLTV